MNQMELPKEEVERMMFFEEARQKAEADYKIAPRDAQVRLARAGPGLGMEVNGETGCSESTAPPPPWMFFFFSSLSLSRLFGRRTWDFFSSAVGHHLHDT